MQTLRRSLGLTALLLGAWAATGWADEGPLFRPALADPRESQIRVRVFSVTQDLRFGTDVADSASLPGWMEDQRGVGWGMSAGRHFRTPPWRRVFGARGPWRRYQLIASGLVRSNFERYGTAYLNVNDFQFGGGVEAEWTGPAADAWTSGAFDRPVVTTRTALQHRSAHHSDEYVSQGDFGANRTGLGLPNPPVRRTALSYEVLHQVVALEWSPTHGASTWRGIAGAEWKLGAMGRRPWNYRSPAYQLGLEFRSAGNRAELGGDPITAVINRWFGEERFGLSWVAAADLRLEKPFDFASLDNPAGNGEVWTPTLWSDGTHGREFRRYAGSWHGLAGLSIWSRARRSVADGGRMVGMESTLALEWFRGYSPHGTFLDMRRREHPRWQVVPSLTLAF